MRLTYNFAELKVSAAVATLFAARMTTAVMESFAAGIHASRHSVSFDKNWLFLLPFALQRNIVGESFEWAAFIAGVTISVEPFLAFCATSSYTI